MYFTAPLSTSLSKRYGCRAVSIAGAIACILGMVLSSFYTSLYHLYLTHGVILGPGLIAVLLPYVYDYIKVLQNTRVSGQWYNYMWQLLRYISIKS